ncbi:HlyD family type I secretion periplasmic adaptor subunit [Alkalimonas collagenimarina]|uniref:Membrane fusion protein (MFP) family protein n=1 Tax=Alkalimonas collagenimarina TaxID=400390 RepID=A0ABT9GUM5_9GAMM|nr:HlyD family type I secretion periplasmic adaptor subunit [Alkalimonas collagenimarina]MDP4534579.1 HlyD family type I secretion periplasmic adaptor subunit [Alkalimonas collagenimarina]
MLTKGLERFLGWFWPAQPAISDQELEYIDDLHSRISFKPPYRARRVLMIISVMVLVFFCWAFFAEIDEVSRGQGRVIPSQQLQVVQNLEGGILQQILVREGEQVTQGQALMSIDRTRFLADVQEQQYQRSTLQADIARYQAELASVRVEVARAYIELQEPDFSSLEMESGNLQHYQALFRERMQGLENVFGIVAEQIQQRQQERAEIESRIGHLQRSYALVEQEINLTRPLARRGVVSEVELLQLERRFTEVQSELDTARFNLPRVNAALQESYRKQVEAALQFRTESQQKLAEASSRLSVLQASLVQLSDRLNRTQVVSPVNGIINSIKINTVGGVIQPGMDLIEIVPQEEALVIEARMSPRDIAFIRPGLTAMVKLTAYDFTIYGGLSGTLEYISADAMVDEQGNSYYLVRVRTEGNFTDPAGEPLPIMPGMIASIDILTGKRTLLQYLLKPITRAKQSALKER